MNWKATFLMFLMLSGLGLTSCFKSRKATAKNRVEHRTSQDDAKNKYASRLGVNSQDLKNERLYVFIDQWEGTPYKYGGTSRSGADCSGFVNALYLDVYQKQLPRTTSALDQSSKKVSRSSLKEGDLVFFDISGKKRSHVGVYLVNNKFVHASSSKGVTISDLENPYYQKAYAKGGRP